MSTVGAAAVVIVLEVTADVSEGSAAVTDPRRSGPVEPLVRPPMLAPRWRRGAGRDARGRR